MKKILMMLSLCCSPLSYSAVSFKEVQAIYSYVQNSSGYHVVLKLDPTLEVNAWTSKYNITVTQGLLNYCNSPGEVALVVGHELGHWAYNDPRKELHGFPIEERADVYGFHQCKKSGFKKCLEFMYRFKKDFGDGSGEDGEHPPWSVRIKNVLDNK